MKNSLRNQIREQANGLITFVVTGIVKLVTQVSWEWVINTTKKM